jgi:hypothetical protein|tara:strand:+ start:968 stop:1072 length:105 start_codon:yes stop_codon:yes gene_type:complete
LHFKNKLNSYINLIDFNPKYKPEATAKENPTNKI